MHQLGKSSANIEIRKNTKVGDEITYSKFEHHHDTKIVTKRVT